MDSFQGAIILHTVPMNCDNIFWSGTNLSKRHTKSCHKAVLDSWDFLKTGFTVEIGEDREVCYGANDRGKIKFRNAIMFNRKKKL
jgi:hypothetical protein